MSKPLSEIEFFSPHAKEVRSIFADAACRTDEDVINCGCTGLVSRLIEYFNLPGEKAVEQATIVRANMEGSGFGLPCYVPERYFCLVHNTVGGLQKGQAQKYASAVSTCSRELHSDEHLHASAVQAAINQEGLKEAQSRFGMEQIEEALIETEPEAASSTPESSLGGFLRQSPLGGSLCPNHSETVWTCRYCLAQLILNGQGTPDVRMKREMVSDRIVEGTLSPGAEIDLRDPAVRSIEVFVSVARWSTKLVRE